MEERRVITEKEKIELLEGSLKMLQGMIDGIKEINSALYDDNERLREQLKSMQDNGMLSRL